MLNMTSACKCATCGGKLSLSRQYEGMSKTGPRLNYFLSIAKQVLIFLVKNGKWYTCR